MATRIPYSIRGEWSDAELLAALDRLIGALAEPAPLLQDIGDRLEANVALRFETKTDPEGKPWDPISPTTVEIYESEWFKARNPAFKNGIPGSLLQRTNAMRQSLAFNVTDAGLELGFSRATNGGKWQVAMLHEFGTVKMPRRGLLTADPETGKLSASDEADVLATINAHLSDLF